MYKAQAYMQFEEETMADAMRYSRTEDNRPPHEQGNKNGDKRHGNRRGRDKSREPQGPPNQFTNYTPLIVPREIVLVECAASDFKNAGIRFPKSTPFKPAEGCYRNFDPAWQVERLCQTEGEPSPGRKARGHPRGQAQVFREKNVALAVWRPEDFYVPKHFKDTYEHPILNEWENFPETMVISGGVFDKHTIVSVKRKFEELITASSGMAVTLGKPKTSSQPLSFYLKELHGGSANSQIPLLVRADMENFDVRRILVDSGSSCDIMYAHLFRTLQLDESHLTPYLGSDLQGFNGATTKPWGYVDLIVTFGHNETAKLIKVKFMVMKYYTNKGQVATLHGDIEAARRCFNAAYKGQSYVGPVPEAKESKTSSEQPGTSTKPPPQQPPQNIGKDVPDLARKQLVACLKHNADLFAWSASEMSGLDPNVACHQLTFDEAATAVVQRRRRQSPEKMELAEKAVTDLLEANFISEAKYTTWLSNVVLVKKSNGKWRMCVDYTDLNRACPKNAYPLPCIDRLVDNSSGFKLLSFLDAYSGYNQIPMAVADRTKTAFMTESGNYYYNVIPFGLKNAGATYQRMMNKVFRGEIGDTLEVYIDDMIVKSHEEVDHTIHLQKVFEQARKVNMRFNPEKCTFGIRAGKFLGFYLTERGIQANPYKCRAFTEFPTPNDKKSIQTLNGLLTALSRFALQHLKKALSEPPVLSRPEVGEVLYLYLAVVSEAVSATLIRETLEGQKPVYFTSKALQGPELRYQRIEKVALALVIAARRLRYYFLAHTVVVRTDQPIKSLLVRPDMAGRKALKAQVLADFMAEMTCSPSSTDGANKWTIFVDGASNATGAGAEIILENEEGILIEVSLALSFPTSNNQAEYEAFLVGLHLAEDVDAKEIKIYTDSQLVASQVLGEYQAKNDNLSEYLALVKERITKFDSAEIQHVPREHNKRADILSKLASTKRKNGNKSVIQEILSHPSIQKPTRVLDINAIGDVNCWMTPVYNYLTHGTLPNDEKEAATVKRRSCSYTLLDNKLYRRGFSIPLLKCTDEATADYILREIHEGINSQHLGGRSLARKALRAGYYWPTMQQDAKEHVKKCDKCQRHGDMHLAPPHELKSLSSPWPFAWWGMDILGPFTRGNLQCRYLIVGVDYFTKWVKAEPLPEITSFRILRFLKRDILCRFGIPQAVVTDDGTQFTDKIFRGFLAKINTKHHFTSVEHPQTNGQAEAVNRVILRGLRRRLGDAKKQWVKELPHVLWIFRGFLAKINTKHHFTSVEHPQTNGQAEAVNRVILRGLRRRLGDAKKQWVKELPHVLWVYRTTPHSTTGETPFRLAYGTEAVIPVEIGEPSRCTEAPLDEEMNDEAMREELDLVEEIRTAASLKEASLKQLVAARYDTKVTKRDFEVGSLVLNAKDSNEGKLAANWEGPYRVRGKTDNDAYHLETLQRKEIPRTWNAQKAPRQRMSRRHPRSSKILMVNSLSSRRVAAKSLASWAPSSSGLNFIIVSFSDRKIVAGCCLRYPCRPKRGGNMNPFVSSTASRSTTKSSICLFAAGGLTMEGLPLAPAGDEELPGVDEAESITCDIAEREDFFLATLFLSATILTSSSAKSAILFATRNIRAKSITEKSK
ncbi:hypothetical protein TSUD_394140 [Trifolium subterraneum]|uniref:Uncharacterized protein n=1 Tax=Trifolium subterraneum TaxID=3900 RepID=A0A2Z6MXP0_TRISU|nr:hypothetical protein TSUD_394140 [Trifolium subterraneum]